MVAMARGRREHPQIRSRKSGEVPRQTGEGPHEPPEERGAVELSDLAVMKGEIDALQIALADQMRPWWKQASAWLAIVALFVTTLTALEQRRLGTEQAEQQRDQGQLAAEAELSGIMTRIETVQRERIEAATIAPPAANEITKILNAQSLVWIYKGADLVDRREDLANAAEYLALAGVINSQIGPTDRVLDYAERAMERARDFRTYALAGQVWAETLFRRNKPSEAEDVLGRTVHPTRGRLLTGTSQDALLNDLSYTHIFWAGSLRVRGDCRGWEQHLAEARKMVKRMAELGYPSGNEAALATEESSSCPSPRTPIPSPPSQSTD
jgi:hypothetical protein